MAEKQKGAGILSRLTKGPIVILLAALGVVLLLLGNGSSGAVGQSESATAKEAQDPLYEYTEMTEQKIAALCTQVKGVSEVSVAVSFEGDFTYVYATDSDTREQDGEAQSKLSYVTVGSGSSEQTVLLTRNFPRVNGVGIVCRGGGSAAVRQELLALLEAAYGISGNHIYITEANP